jgi:hypothetical protein
LVEEAEGLPLRWAFEGWDASLLCSSCPSTFCQFSSTTAAIHPDLAKEDSMLHSQWQMEPVKDLPFDPDQTAVELDK